MKTVTYIRPSGSKIELADTKAHRKFAKDNGFKKKRRAEKPAQLEIGGDNA